METLTIRPPKGVSLDKAKLALENLNFEIITNTKDSVQVSPEVLNMIDEALEEEKKGIFPLGVLHKDEEKIEYTKAYDMVRKAAMSNEAINFEELA